MKKPFAFLIVTVLILGGVLSAQALENDEFEGSDISSFWDIQDRGSTWEQKDGWLVFEAGFNQNLWASDTPTRFTQMADQDFDIETSMIVDYKNTSTVAGIIIYSATTQDHQSRDGQWVTLKLWGRGAAQDNNAVLQYQRRENDDGALGYVGTQPDYNPSQDNPIPIALRIQRTGDEYESWFKPNNEGDWVLVGKVTNDLQPPLEVGIYVGIADAEAADASMTVSFDYFREASNPVTAVDPRDRLAVTWGDLKRK